MTEKNLEKHIWLLRYLRQCGKVTRLIRDLHKAQEETLSMQIHFTETRSGQGDGQRIPRAYERVLALEQELDTACALRDRLREETEGCIGALGEDVLIELMLYRYIDGIDHWQQLAGRLHYSERHTQRLYGKALAAVEIPKKEKAPE